MTHNRFFLLVIGVLFSVFCFSQTVGIEPFGYGASATGGGSAAPTLVSNLSELKSALSKPSNKVIVITQDITLDGVVQVKDASNVTLLGLPGVTLYNPTWNVALADGNKKTGIFEFVRISNLIIRNLTFEGPGSYDCDGRDHLTLDCVTNAWIDHCDFSDAVDDCMDIKKLSDNITVSWCKFHYDKAYHPNGPGDAAGDKDHRFVSLLGSSSSDKPSDGTYNVTYAYLWFGEGCMQRMIRCRNASLHFLGCYWNSSKASYYIGPENVSSYIELCTFEGGPKAANIYKAYNSTKNPVKFVNSTSKNGFPAEYGSVSAPSYAYQKYASAAEAKTAVTNEDCGAGATLDIQVSGSTVTIQSGCATPKTQYTITFNANGGTGSMAAQQGYENANTTINACTFSPVSGKAFAGWNTAANGSGTSYADQGTIVLTQNITLYAQWAAAYTATFNANGHGSAPAAQTVGSGTKLTEPVAPTEIGWVFGGWYKEAACVNAWDFSSMTLTSNVTLYAKWTEKACDEQVWYQYAGDVPQGAAQATCFTFDVTPTGTSGGEFTMTIDGTEYHATKRAADWNSTIQFTVPAGQTGVFYMHAKSSGSTRTVTISNGGGTLSVAGSTLATYSSASLSAGTYTVSTNGNLHIAMLALQLCGGSTPTPATQYTVSFNSNGHGSAPASQSVIENGRADEPTAPTASGYDFGGWYKDEACNNPWSFATDLVTANTTLYAKWTAVVVGKATISFNMNGHGAAPADQSVTIGSYATVPATPTATGWTFVDWFDNAEGEGDPWDFAGNAVSSNMTLYAKWEENLTTTWSLIGDVEGEFVKNAGESTGTIAYLTLYMNANTTYDINLYDATNTFTSATAISSSVSNLAFSQGAATVPLKTTVAGNYEFRLDYSSASAPRLTITYPASYTATFNANGHGTAPATQTLASGALVKEPVALNADGYMFGGWFKEAACVNAWNFATMTLTSNVTLYAKWTEVAAGSNTCWNISDESFASLGTISATTTQNGLTIYANSSATVIVDASSKSCDGKDFTKRLKLGGTGVADARSLAFAVSGACTIDIYAISSSSSTDRTLTLRAGSFTGTEIGTASAPGSTLTKTSINYTGAATTIYVYSPSSGVNIYDMCVTYGATPATYTVTYNLNGHGAAIADVNGVTALPNPLPTPSASGFDFGGWFLNAGLTLSATAGSAISANTTLYAKWTEQAAVGGYTISYNMNGHGSSIADVTNATALPNPLPSPSASGYDFGGWYTNSGLTSAATAGAAISQNTMLYAKWTASSVAPITPSSGNEGGWFESCWMEFDKGIYSQFVGYISADNGSTWEKLDEQLVRTYSSYGRLDAVGLAAGTYMLKAIPVNAGVEDCENARISGALRVVNHNRQGFAHTGEYRTTGVGAYNNDGTLKSGARVLYVTAATAKTVQLSMKTSSSSETLLTGLQTIIAAYEKGYESRPLAIRIIGTIRAADMDAFGSSAEGLQIKGKGYTTINLTLEGIGKDAAIHGFGILGRGVSSVEFRNFAILNCMDDCLGLDTKNSYVWIHNIDFYYGQAGSAADQVKGDGTVDIKADSKWVSVSYNHFFDSGKMSLCGMKSETGANYITYHHNHFDHSDSRHPRIRTMSVHIYNNYYDGNAKYGVGACMGASAFVEANYFRACTKPMMSSMQGTDAQGDGTFSGENGGIIKAYNNYFATSVNYITYQQNATSFDAYEVSNRSAKVPSNVVTLQGGTSYDNFDTEYAEMYSVTLDDPQQIPSIVTGTYGAGRLQHGDLPFTFSSADDKDYTVNSSLKSQVVGYTAPALSLAGNNTASECADVAGYNVMAQVDPAGYGSIDRTLISGVTEATAISAAGNTLTVGSTSIVATPAAATAEYTYAFTNWTWTPSGSTVTANVTATANFTRTPKSYTLTWVTDGDALSGSYTSGSTAFGTTIVRPNTPTKTGYTFTGWSPSPATTMPAANTTYTAQWRSNSVAATYSITYNCDGATGGCPADATEQTALPDPLPAAPTKAGYTFGGWYTNAGFEFEAVAGATISANTTLYAKWTAVAAGGECEIFSLQMKADAADCGVAKNGGTLEMSATYADVDGGTVTLKNIDTSSDDKIRIRNYEINWNGGKGFAIVTLADNSLRAGDVIAFATDQTAQDLWLTNEETRPSSAPTARATSSTSYTVKADDNIVGSSTFYIWRNSSSTYVKSITITRPDCGAASTYDVTITANPAGYGTVSSTSISNVSENTAITKSSNRLTIGSTTITATPADATSEYTYAFGSWTWTPAGDAVTANTTVTANFVREPKSYTLTWDANGGDALTGDYTTGSVPFGTSIVPPSTPTRTGYTFNGWNPTPAATMPAANTTYTAQWTENPKETPVVTWTVASTVYAGGVYSISVSTTTDAVLSAANLTATNGTLTNKVVDGHTISATLTIANDASSAPTLTLQTAATANYEAGDDTKDNITLGSCSGGGGSGTEIFKVIFTSVPSNTKNDSTVEVGTMSWKGLQSGAVINETTYLKLSGDLQMSKGVLSNHILCSPTSALQAGDQITIKYVCTNADHNQPTKIYTNAAVLVSTLAQPSAKNAETVDTYTVVEEDGIAGANSFCVGRGGSNNYINSIIVTRPGSGGGSSLRTPAMTWSNAQADGATVNKKTPDANFTITASANTTGAISYASSNTSVATVNASTGEVDILSTGTATITATVAEAGCFDEGSITYLLNVTSDVNYTLNITASPAGYGSVSTTGQVVPEGATISSSSNTFDIYPSDVTVTATPAAATAQYTYAFDRWENLPSTVTADATITAVFTRSIRQYTLTFNSKEGSAVASQDIDYNGHPTAVTDPQKDDNTFEGWSLTDGGDVVADITTLTITGNTTLYAVWTAVDYCFELKDIKATPTAGQYVPAEKATITGGKIYVPNSIGSYDGTKKWCFGGSDDSLRVELDAPLAVGSVISITYSTNDENRGIRMMDAPKSETHTYDFLNASSATNVTTSYTITADDGFAGLSKFWLTRATGNNTYISRITILGCSSCSSAGVVYAQKAVSKTTDDLPFTHTLTNPNGVTVAYVSSNTEVATVNASTGEVTIVGVGTTTITASYAEQGGYCAGADSYTLTVGLPVCFNILTTATAGTVSMGATIAESLATVTAGGSVTYVRKDGTDLTIDASKGIKLGSQKDSLRIALPTGTCLGEGTVIRVVGYTGSTNRGVRIYSPNPTNAVEITTSVSGNFDLTYTLQVGDPLLDASVFGLSLVGGTTYLNSLYIYNCGTPCVDARPSIAITAGQALKCAADNVTLTATGAEAGATFQWYRDGEAVAGETAAAITTNKEGTYTLVANKACYRTSNAITITNKNTSSVFAIYDEYYIKQDRKTPLIPLFYAPGLDSWTVTPAISGCTYVNHGDTIYLSGVANNIPEEDDQVLTLSFDLGCGADTKTMTLHLLPTTPNPTLAYIVEGTTAAGFTEGCIASQSTSHALFTYLQTSYDVTACNEYSTTDEKAICQFYSQFDIVLITDYPSTKQLDSNKKSYGNALGVLVDKIPLLTLETYVSGNSNWSRVGLTANPKTPQVGSANSDQTRMQLLCPAHDIFTDAKEGDHIDVITDLPADDGKKETTGLQGFLSTEAPDGMIFIATIDGGDYGTLISCCERQAVVEARMLMFGVNYYGSQYLSVSGKKAIKQMLDYLLKKEKSQVADCAIVFDNGRDGSVTPRAGSGDNLWSNPANWNEGILPASLKAIRIEQPCIVDVQNAAPSSIKLNKGTNLLGVECDGSITVRPTGALAVASFIKEVHGTDYVTMYTSAPEDLVIQADASHQGALALGSTESVPATVQFYSKASYVSEATWQYMGTPINDMNSAVNFFRGAWICEWLEGIPNVVPAMTNWAYLGNDDRINPFQGYAITQAAAKTYTITGNLLPGTSVTCDLSYTTSAAELYKGANLLANSWMAPMKISGFEVADFHNTEATVYVYNTGSQTDWTAAGSGTAVTTVSSTLGQYVGVPVAAGKDWSIVDASLQTVAPMQGFFVNATAVDATVNLDFARLVFSTEGLVNHPQRAPQRHELRQPVKVQVNGSRLSDVVYILPDESYDADFENGYDAHKMEGSELAPMLAYKAVCGDLSVAAVPSVDSALISFRAGEDSLYTLTFTGIPAGYQLTDLYTGAEVPLYEGATYTFVPATLTERENRFLITDVRSIATPTDLSSVSASAEGLLLENLSGEVVTLLLYDSGGRLLYSLTTDEPRAVADITLVPGVYVVSLQSKHGVKSEKIIF